MIETRVGHVAKIWRYPLKSMLGEEIRDTLVTHRGVVGDRGYALFDPDKKHIASAKDPRQWPLMFQFRAEYTNPPTENEPLPPIRVTMPSGEKVTSDDADAAARIGKEMGRTVELLKTPIAEATAEGYWPDQKWLVNRNTSFSYQFPKGTFFDGSMVHLITTATLDHLSRHYPESRFELPRFRANFLIETDGDELGFAENEWIGRTLTLGTVRLQIERPCPRCVMTTLAQSDLPTDLTVLRAAVKENDGNVGVYARVETAGRIRVGDAVTDLSVVRAARKHDEEQSPRAVG